MFREKAAKLFHEDGKLEIDADAKVSLSYNEEKADRPVQGAYVQAWVWVDAD